MGEELVQKFLEEEVEPPVEQEIHEVTLVIPVEYIESVNKLNQCGYKWVPGPSGRTKKKVMAMILTPQARAAMHNYFSVLERYVPAKSIPNAKFVNLEVTMGFYCSPKTFHRRDNDNMVKIFQDCLSHHFGFNDNQILTIHTYKRCINAKTRKSSSEYVYVKIKNRAKEERDLLVEESDLLAQVGVQYK